MNEPNPISEARSNAARENGKKSHGPVTPKGKEKSRMNALKFGFYSAKDIILQTESADQFERFRESYYDQYLPECDREAELVEEIASCAWRLRRIPMIARDLLQGSSSRDLGSFFCENCDRMTKLDRHQRSLRRSKKEAVEELELFQKQKRQNEPKGLKPGNTIFQNLPPNSSLLELGDLQNEPKNAEALLRDELTKKGIVFADDPRVQHKCAEEIMTRLKRSDPVKYGELQIIESTKRTQDERPQGEETVGETENDKTNPRTETDPLKDVSPGEIMRRLKRLDPKKYRD